MVEGIVSETRAEFAMLCDSAQVLAGKLYVLGGAWDRAVRWVSSGVGAPIPPTQFFIAAAFLVDWNDTNRILEMRVAIEELDERPPLFEMRAQVTVGRPPQAPPGNPLRHLVALPAAVLFPRAGTFALRSRIEAGPEYISRFQVIDAVIPYPQSPGPVDAGT